MSKFDLFLQQSKFESKIINESKLVSCEISNGDNSWTLNVRLKEVVSVADLKPFLTNLKSYFLIPGVVSKVNVKLSYDKIKRLADYSRDYFDLICREVAEEKSRFLAFLSFKHEYKDEKYIIKIDQDSEYLIGLVNELKEKFHEYGLLVDVEAVIDEEIKTTTESIKENIKSQHELNIQKAKIIEQQRQVERKRITDTRRKSKPTSISISEIPINQYKLHQYRNEVGDTRFVVEGEVIDIEIKKLRTATLLQMTIADPDDAIVVKRFLNTETQLLEAESIKEGDLVQVEGNAEYDQYLKDTTIMANTITFMKNLTKVERMDKAKEKRIEFHTHTKMSPMDAVTDVEAYLNTAEKWGHKAIAFTDHNGLYAFPDIHKASKNLKIKPIYGVEMELVDDEEFKITNEAPNFNLREATYVVFDIETTGLSITNDKIIEIGAVKMVQGVVTDRFETFVSPNRKLSAKITDLTGITDEQLVDAPQIEEVMPKFLEFIKGTVLVAHNAHFDVDHIIHNCINLGLEAPQNPVIDTLNLARYFYSNELKRFNLDAVAKYFKVNNFTHHRAGDDAKATQEVFSLMLLDLYKLGVEKFHDINNYLSKNEKYKHVAFPPHVNILVRNQVGYKNLFILVSEALTTYFYQGPRLLKRLLEEYREGLLVGSGCYEGEVFETALNKSTDQLLEVMKFYDYIEVQPPQVYTHVAEDIGENGEEIVKATIYKIINAAKSLNKLVIATGDVHYLNKEDKIYRDIYINAPLIGGGIHKLLKTKKRPDQHLLTTDEMLKSFSFLSPDLAYEIVVTNTNKLNDKIEPIKAFPDELYSLDDDAFKDLLGVNSINNEVKRIVYENLTNQYGKNPHPLIVKRVEKELSSIISNHFAPIYYISYLLVKKSLEDGYLVGSRGSVGSSLVATLLNVTEVNPLPPHYYCSNHCFTAIKMTQEEIFEFGQTREQMKFDKIINGVESGYDLPDKRCPVCGAKLNKDGHNIPFETFLGFKGDKVPDIDLNFSGDYQSIAHEYVRELLGEDFTFRAGTIQKVAERNAYGYVKRFIEDHELEIRDAQINRLAKKIEGVRRSTGQHPGGIVVVPKSHSIYDVTPIQYPADDTTATWKTTHFDYHSFEDNLLKLDILGHDDPTMIKFLMDYVHEHPDEFPFQRAQDIPLDDPKVYKLFQGTDVIGVKPEQILSGVASYGIPELGTQFVREMLQDTKPNSFAGLVKISGLSHGTDVWLNNAIDLVKGETPYGAIPFDDLIGCRDDIMVVLIKDYNMEPLMAFEIMEFVRRGRPSSHQAKWLEYVEIMRKHNVPEWYIESAGKIKYMFPKAHATAYIIMAMRIAWFKVYKPELFYSAFFSKRAVQFDYKVMISGINAITNSLNELQEKFNRSAKENDLIVTLGVALEMLQRGYKLLPVDIFKSEAKDFIIEEDGLRMPFVTIDGLGEVVAFDIVNRREEMPFTSRNDIRNRTRINKTSFDRLESYGAFKDLNEEKNVINVGLFAL
ncbi:MAG: PolC-type DNA polymerase III [Acholeplasmataceae bacterium]